MENKMYAKPQYKCGVCGTIFDSIAERMNCEAKCLKRQEEEAKKAAEAKKREEQEARHAKVEKMLHEAITELQEYCKDYGYFETNDSDLNFFWPSKLHHYFL